MKGLVLTSAVAVAAFAVAAPFETVIAPRMNETWRGAMLKESVRQPYAADAKAVNLASFDGAFVHFGSETSREEINRRFRQDWEAVIASGDSEALVVLRGSRLAQPNPGVPIILR